MTSENVLLIQSSARTDASVTRRLSQALAERIGGTIVTRDVAPGPEFVDGDWVGANFTPAADRTDAQHARLSGSDVLVAELQAADTIVIGLPIYNFGMPASLKAWIDQVARSKVTFEYGDTGPRGLLTGKRAFIVVASGGTEAFGDVDYATPHLRHVLGFLGITDVTVVRADQQMVKGEAIVEAAERQIEELAVAA